MITQTITAEALKNILQQRDDGLTNFGNPNFTYFLLFLSAFGIVTMAGYLFFHFYLFPERDPNESVIELTKMEEV